MAQNHGRAQKRTSSRSWSRLSSNRLLSFDRLMGQNPSLPAFPPALSFLSSAVKSSFQSELVCHWLVLFTRGLEKVCLGKMCSAKAERSGVTVQMTLEPPIASRHAMIISAFWIEQSFNEYRTNGCRRGETFDMFGSTQEYPSLSLLHSCYILVYEYAIVSPKQQFLRASPSLLDSIFSVL